MTVSQTDYTPRARLSVLRSGVVFSTAIAASIPVFVLALIYVRTVGVVGVVLATLLGLLFGGGVGAALYWLNFRNLERMLNVYVEQIERAAAGDMRVRLEIPQSEQTNEDRLLVRLGGSVNRFMDRMHGMVQEVQFALQQLESDTEAILDAAEKQILSANEQDAVVTETTATVNEVRATVTETAERASGVAETAQNAADISRRGDEAVAATISGMDVIRRRVEDIADNILVLSEHTQQIGEIIATVNNLADQSRMLALNASVEAARAGEEGKGFAVVAMEVRNLADQNRDATVQVREILGEIQRATNGAVMVTEEGSKGVDEGQQLVNRAGESIRELAKAIEEAAFAAMQIAASTREQTIGVDQLTGAMRTIKHATAEAITSTMQVETSANRLREAAHRVNDALTSLEV
ncbi:MAG: methyl-accepting chemotaxis protein [Chloroflexota bacterium]